MKRDRHILLVGVLFGITVTMIIDLVIYILSK